jgi:putative ABC transport system substrate-binding protein
MRRRAFIAGLGGAAAWSVGVFAEQADKPRRVGLLFGSTIDAATRSWVTAFEQELRQLGWMIGQNLVIETRFAGGDIDRLRRQTAELVNLQADVIVASGTLQMKILQEFTKTIPVVFAQASDPVGDGFVASIARPGGNATGFPNVEATMSAKWLELLKEAAPRTARIGLLFHPEASPRGGSFFWMPAQAAASILGIALVQLPVRDDAGIHSAFDALVAERGTGVIVTPDSFVAGKRDVIIAALARHRLPAIYPFREFTESGGLMSYGAVSIDLYRRAASYVSRILNGERPADLPVQQPTKFELVINLKTAKTLGLDIPPTLLARADEVIE